MSQPVLRTAWRFFAGTCIEDFACGVDAGRACNRDGYRALQSGIRRIVWCKQPYCVYGSCLWYHCGILPRERAGHCLLVAADKFRFLKFQHGQWLSVGQGLFFQGYLCAIFQADRNLVCELYMYGSCYILIIARFYGNCYGSLVIDVSFVERIGQVSVRYDRLPDVCCRSCLRLHFIDCCPAVCRKQRRKADAVCVLSCIRIRPVYVID